jgi:ABC-type transporter Mla subunit MlaD
MPTEKETNYFRIGAFVLIGIIAIVLGIALLGSGKLFKKTIIIETYFNESIQGLSVGSAVKYQGVEIGHVEKIAFVNQIYNNHKRETDTPYGRYVYVEMSISPNLLSGPSFKPTKKLLEEDVTQGLRVKLALQGLTGSAYLELNFIKPKSNHLLPIDWEPNHYYIPSMTSTLTQFSDNLQSLLDELKKANISEILDNTKKLTAATTKTMSQINILLARTSQQIKNTADNSEIISENLRDFSARVKDYPSQLIFGKAPPTLDPNNL